MDASRHPADGLIAACAVVRNEQAGIAEWIAYHFAVGFDTLILYDNASTDDTRAIVDRMSQIGDVRCISWDRRDARFQNDANDEALERFGREFEWMFFIDADEFVVPLSHDSIAPVMASFGSEVAAVGFNWLMYGSSGLLEQPEGTLLMEAFRGHSEATFEPNNHVKSAVRPERALSVLSPHAFEVSGRYVGGDGSDANWRHPGVIAELPPRYGGARINHYFTKSRAQWEAKLARGNPALERSPEEFDLYDRNEQQDDLILRHVQATRDLLAAAGCLP
ncbi:MAG TPA: glycosyltransferase family 2 protein [Galbitalea sp.]|nr:glycosyltransferase family 2 protein [Galbitalea sp.]